MMEKGLIIFMADFYGFFGNDNEAQLQIPIH